MDLTDKTGPELVAIYNKAAESVGEQPVKRFKDRATAIRRTEEVLAKAKPATVPKRRKLISWPPGKGKGRKVRGQWKGVEALNSRFLKVLDRPNGATQEELEAVVVQFDKDTGRDIGKVPSRVRSILRMLHTIQSYGIEETEPGRFKVIFS